MRVPEFCKGSVSLVSIEEMGFAKTYQAMKVLLKVLVVNLVARVLCVCCYNQHVSELRNGGLGTLDEEDQRKANLR